MAESERGMSEQKITRFKELHESGCFVMPNPWGKGSAIYLESLGFKALATTSAGLGFSLGIPDSVGAIPLEIVLNHFREIVQATSLPVNADFQEGYADLPEEVAQNVRQCVSTGIAGLSIEDATGKASNPLYEKELAVDRIIAARQAIDASGTGVILTARCESWLVGDPNPFETAINRLVQYAEAGADCLFAPGVRDPKQIEQIVKAVHPKPVNVLVGSAVPGLTVSRLAEVGVRRISVGSALARAAWGNFMKCAEDIAHNGRFDSLVDAAPFERINRVFEGNKSDTKILSE